MLIALLSILIIVCAILLSNFQTEKKKVIQLRQHLVNETQKHEHTKHIASAVLKNIRAFVLLIDEDLKVLRTNYYHLTRTPKGTEEKKVGDLLKCSNALSAQGGCGTHSYCDSCPIRKTIRQAFKEKKSFANLEATLNIKDSDSKQTRCDTLISGSYFIVNEVPNIVLTIHDITTLKQNEKELIEAKERAEKADLSKSTFLANMSHEIRTPINAITGFAEILDSANTEEEKAQYREIIKMNADLLLQLVNDILDMSKIEAGTLDFIYSEVDINLLVSDLHQFFQMKINDTGKVLDLIAETPLTSCIIEIDRNRVAQVLSNFMTNALKFTAEGTIQIGYIPKETELYFYVKDTGSGIPENKLPEVFERFVRLNKEKKGTGLGLPISQTIIKKLNGQIGVESVEGKGSKFWFTIPYSTSGKPR